MSEQLDNLSNRDGEIINNWYVACLAKDVNSSPIQREIYDTKLVLFRNEKGEVTCLLDRCPHRGTPLSKGQCLNGKIQCSYHGWIFDDKGIVSKIPSEGERASKVKRHVRSFRTYEKDSLIWIWMGKEGDEDIEKIWNFPHKTESGWNSYYMVTDFENEVTNLVENFVDVPHTVWVHKGWFRNRSFQEVPTKVTTKDGKVLVEYDQPEDNIGVLIKPLLNPKNEPMFHTDEFIYPNITNVVYSFGSHFKYVINSQCTPVSTFKSRVYTHIAYKLPFGGRFIRPFLNFYTQQVINQDVQIMSHQKQNLINEKAPKFQSTEADEPHIQIERLRKVGTTDQQKAYGLTKERDISFYI